MVAQGGKQLGRRDMQAHSPCDQEERHNYSQLSSLFMQSFKNHPRAPARGLSLLRACQGASTSCGRRISDLPDLSPFT